MTIAMWQISALAILSIGASIPPLCLYAWLWQVKEWRWDRLHEHLARDGVRHLLLGTVRPAIVAIWCVIGLGVFWLYPTSHSLLIATYGSLISSLIIQLPSFVTRGRKPDWTSKAKILVEGTLLIQVLTQALLLVFASPIGLVFALFAPILQPLYLGLAWTCFMPIDRWQKKKILARAAQLRDQFPDMIVIGVTGSVGKTTTKAVLGHLLAPYQALVTPEYVNSEIGIARWLTTELSKLSTSEVPKKLIAVIEMGAYRRGEIATICRCTKPTHGIITYIGTQHIGLFGSQENIRLGKGELFSHLPANGHAYLNGDHELTRTVSTLATCPVTIVGTGGQDDMEAHDIEETPTGVAFSIGTSRFQVGLHGTHNVVNVLLAIAAAKDLGMDDATIQRLLRTFAPPSRTFAVRSVGSIRLLDDTHNSSAASMKAAIAWAKSQPFDHKTLVTCGLIEMGDLGDKAQTEIGALAGDVFQRIIFVGSNGRQAFQQDCRIVLESPSPQPSQVPGNSLVVAVGRVPESLVTSLLPS